jgi:DNA-binding NtrC family response regulator
LRTDHIIFVVDDDVPLNNLICKYLEKQGFTNVKGFFTGDELLREISSATNAIIIQDFDLPDINGLDLLKKIKTEHPKTEFIFLSGQSSIDVAVEAINFGAFDYIIKDNFAKENTLTKIRNLLKIKRLVKERLIFRIGLLAVSIFAVLMLFIFYILYFLN